MQFIVNFLLTIVCLLLFACTLGSKGTGELKKNLDQYYQSSGVVHYFLSELPDWANYSETGKCVRSIRVKYVHMKNMMESFNLEYNQLIHFQYQFNKDYQMLSQFYENKNLFLKNEESLFYDVLDKIKSGIYAFHKPKFERVNLIWIDPLLNSDDFNRQLEKVFARPEMLLGHPVVISMCKDHYAITEVLKKTKLDKYDVRIIPAEMFSIFLEDGKRDFSFSVNLKGMFSAEQKIYLYTPMKVAPKEIIGNFKLEPL
ncbi:MAG: hypothetical protein A2381_16200 [Bdellovibrionales bacterium RIFOXYB1_FULL_37_110]|nr:MAG: hypothetical protein A2417_08050 [Bdellovibrionales bacterium RIFOXYC1_FULL_37_79]OFZ57155.1 MAG: hypothetical protein A2381_16200 [Bdellovibrionales bacterium RIFOXYB1_FULL_37_110]OFZ65361.1 MAG: hypothetical protein A2577_03670 [Bdellovibrionales bacterium RIFOXYD1_FULL_36_51]